MAAFGQSQQAGVAHIPAISDINDLAFGYRESVLGD
jgi:hypothetical protein